MRLIVTNGDVAAGKLRDGGIGDDIMAWRDVLHEGPVPAEERLETLSQIRAAYIAREFGLPHDEVAMSFAERDSEIRTHRDYDRIEIWVEHDLYDQLQLLQILDFFAEQRRTDGIFLVQTADYLSSLTEDAVRTMEAQAAPVSFEQFELACRAWEAFTSPDPARLVAIMAEETSALPYLKTAFSRLLAEFPDPVHGLGLTEERMLRRLQKGPATASQLYQEVTAQESARFMGDASFFGRLNAMTFVNEPLVQGVNEPIRVAPDGAESPAQDTVLRITQAGRKVLGGSLDHAMVNDVDRWIGGTRLRPALLLRYDRHSGELIAPP